VRRAIRAAPIRQNKLARGSQKKKRGVRGAGELKPQGSREHVWALSEGGEEAGSKGSMILYTGELIEYVHDEKKGKGQRLAGRGISKRKKKKKEKKEHEKYTIWVILGVALVGAAREHLREKRMRRRGKKKRVARPITSKATDRGERR